MKNLYMFLNEIFDPELNNYLTEKAADLIDTTMKSVVEQKIGAKEFGSLEDFITKNYSENKFRELGEAVGTLISISQMGRIHFYDEIHPVLYDQARGGALLLCGLNYYLRNHDYDLDKTYDNVCGTKIVIGDNGLVDYIEDIGDIS